MKTFYTLLILVLGISLKAFGQQPLQLSDNIQKMSTALHISTAEEYPKFAGNLYEDIVKRDDFRKNIFPYRQTLTLSLGYSSIQHYTRQFLQNRSQEQTFTFQNYYAQPIISLTHEIYWGAIFSTSYTLGYGSNKIYADGAPIASKNLLVFIHPKLNYFRSEHFEAYFQLNVGMVYNDLDIEAINDPTLAYNVPANFKAYTGFTPLGFNILVNEKFALNTSLSLWSYETFKVGLKYRFQKNTIRQEMWEEKMNNRYGIVQ